MNGCEVCGHDLTPAHDGWYRCGCCKTLQRDHDADALVGKAMLNDWHNREGS